MKKPTHEETDTGRNRHMKKPTHEETDAGRHRCMKKPTQRFESDT